LSSDINRERVGPEVKVKITITEKSTTHNNLDKQNIKIQIINNFSWPNLYNTHKYIPFTKQMNLTQSIHVVSLKSLLLFLFTNNVSC
jgi:hypothetical protein